MAGRDREIAEVHASGLGNAACSAQAVRGNGQLLFTLMFFCQLKAKMSFLFGVFLFGTAQ